MKKFIFAFAVVTLFASAQFASAAMTLNPSSHPVYGDPAKGMDTTIIGYISDIDWNASQAEALARNGQHLPIVKADQTVKDETGIEYTCSNFMVSRHDCVSLVGTPAYRNNMLTIARTLFNQQAAYPRFAGWFKIVSGK